MSTTEKIPRELPNDLILNIISRLSAKSVARCRCVSKLWASLLNSGSPYFTELFLTHSKTRPRLLFTVVRNNNELGIYSCPQPQPQILYENQKSSLSVTAEFYMFLRRDWFLDISATFSGVFNWYDISNDNSPGICNPSTRYLLRLPQQPMTTLGSYFGYDPIDKQCSVLSITVDYSLPSHHQCFNYQILKLGSRSVSWRNIECPLDYHPLQCNICINGVLYYITFSKIDNSRKIVCFDLNSQEFMFVDAPWPQWPNLLVNFKGKLGGIETTWVEFSEESCNLELSLWVLEDVEEQGWSKHVYHLPSKLWNTKLSDVSVVGLTATGEVVLSLGYITHPFYVYFFNLEKNVLQKVEIKGFENFKLHHSLQGCVDYVEDLKDLN